METAVEVQGLSKRFGDKLAVDDLSFSVGFGRIVGFLGPNGAGKTTTLRAVLGLINPTGGSATITGQAYTQLADPAGTVGALLDGVPESVVIGASLLAGGPVSLVTVIAVFLSNVPEGLSSAAGMRQAGRTRRYVFGLWTAIALISGAASLAGYTLLGGAPPEVLATITALAAGAILAMITDTMVPEAFADAHLLVGLITVLGFLVAFALSHA